MWLRGIFRLPGIRLASHSPGLRISSTRGGSALANSSATFAARHSLGLPNEVGPCRKRCHAPVKIASYVIESDAAQAQRSFLFAARLGNNHDRPGAIEQCSRPGSVLAAKPDIDAAGKMPFGELGSVAHIENLSACISQSNDFIERDRLQNLLKVDVERYTLARVENGVVCKVLRSIGLVRGDERNKLILRHGLQRVVHTALIAERRDRVRRKLLTA